MRLKTPSEDFAFSYRLYLRSSAANPFLAIL
jgi:hypothetical protein